MSIMSPMASVFCVCWQLEDTFWIGTIIDGFISNHQLYGFLYNDINKFYFCLTVNTCNSLMGHSAKQTVTEETKLFGASSLGRSPDG